MSSGKNHDRATLALGALLFAASWQQGTSFLGGLSISSGCLLGGLLISPDLDQSHSNPSQRWGVLRFMWKPYQALIPYHRHWRSHSPIISSALVLAYLGGCLVLVVLALSIPFWLKGWRSPADYATELTKWILATYPNQVAAFLIGVELSRDLHLIMDWQYSFRRKLSKQTR